MAGTWWCRGRADAAGDDGLAARPLAWCGDPRAPEEGPGPQWTGERGLPDALWEKVLANVDACGWARARSACRELRLLGMAPGVLRAQQERWGVGHRATAAGHAPDFACVLRHMARRGRLQNNLARRQLHVDLAPAGAAPPEDSVVLPELRLLTIDADGEGRLRSLAAEALGAPNTAPPSMPDEAPGAFLYSGLRLVTRRSLGFVSPPPFFHWRATAALTPVQGWLNCGAGEVQLVATSGDAQRGLALVGEDEVVVGNGRSGAAWRWRPGQVCGWRLGRPSPRLVAGALPGSGGTAAILDASPALTGWRLGGQAPELVWGRLPVAGPPQATLGTADGTLAGRGSLVASDDGRHLMAVPPSCGPDGRLTPGPPSLLRLAGGGSVAAGPWPLREAADEGELAIVFSLDGGCLAAAVARSDGGFEARHWRLGVGTGRPTATVFARGIARIAHLALSPDGALAALAEGRGQARGTVALWRLDGPRGPCHIWDFSPGHIIYRRIVFGEAGDALVLAPRLGGALVLRLAVDGRAAELGNSVVAPGRPYRDVSSYHLDDISRLRLGRG